MVIKMVPIRHREAVNMVAHLKWLTMVLGMLSSPPEAITTVPRHRKAGTETIMGTAGMDSMVVMATGDDSQIKTGRVGFARLCEPLDQGSMLHDTQYVSSNKLCCK